MTHTIYQVQGEHSPFKEILTIKLNFDYDESKHSIHFLDSFNEKMYFIEEDEEEKRYSREFNDIEELEKFLKRKLKLKPLLFKEMKD